MDLIDRQAAIDAISNDPMGGLNYRRILTDLPSAAPDLSGYSDRLWRNAYERGKAEAGRWIPCSERLPEVVKDGSYFDDETGERVEHYSSDLVLVTDGSGYDIACFGGYRKENGEYIGGHFMIDDDDVIAWQPLPEPYREEDENDQT